MENITQKDLLNEGFWSGFGRTVKGAAVLGKEALKTVAPELTQPVSNAINKFKDIKHKVDLAVIPKYKKFFQQLLTQGYYLTSKPDQLKKITNKIDGTENYLVDIAILDYDKNQNPIPDPTRPKRRVVIDQDGRLLRDLSKAAAPLSKTVHPNRKKTRKKP